MNQELKEHLELGGHKPPVTDDKRLYDRGFADGYSQAKTELYVQIREALMFGNLSELEVRLKRIFGVE